MRRALVILAAAGLAFGSCSRGSDAPPSGGTTPGPDAPVENQTPASPRVISLQDLPALGPALPPLDDKRVEVAPPADWSVLSRKSGYLARFHRDNMPRILITAEPATGASIDNVTSENAGTLESMIRSAVAANLVGGEQLLQPVAATTIGNRIWAVYVRRGRVKRNVDGQSVSSSIEREFLTTLVNGRLYTIELQAYAATREDYSREAYAVAAGMKFTAPRTDSSATPQPTSEPAPPQPAPPDSDT